MGKVISFINLKGGVGKTTCVANIAGELAHENRKVLVIDVDAQANVSTLLMGPKRYRKQVLKVDSEDALDPKDTVYQIFLDEIDKTDKFKPGMAIRKNVVKFTKRQKLTSPLPKLDLLPSTASLMALERKIVTYERTKFIILYKVLQKIKELYDFILIDCPPNIYTSTHNALYASDYYIIPTSPEFLSITGIPFLINSLKDTILIKNEERNESVECAGILVNMMNMQLNIHKDTLKRIKTFLEKFKEKDLVSKNAVVFKTTIKNKVDIKNSADIYAPLCITHPRSDSTAEFKTLCSEILERINGE